MPKRYFEEERDTDNPTVYWKARRFRVLYCNYCKPNRDENLRGRVPRHDRYKSVRKGRCAGSIEPPCRDVEHRWHRGRAGAPAKRYMKRTPSWW